MQDGLECVRDIKIQLSEKQQTIIDKKVNSFVKRQLHPDQSIPYYEKARDVDRDQAINDNLIGKKGEFIAAIALHTQFRLPLIIPDLKIYRRRKKNWKADLRNRDFNFHVKTCNKWLVGFCGDFSWTFQYQSRVGNHGEDAILSKPSNDMVVFVYLPDFKSSFGVVKAIVSVSTLQRLQLFDDPKLEKHVGFKKCVYYNRLLSSI